MTTGAAALPWAVVLGDSDLLRPVADTGAPCALVADAREPARHSRRVRAVLDVDWEDRDGALAALLDFAAGCAEPPVVLYEWEWHLEALSRSRDALDGRVRAVLPSAELVEDLLDKERFADLAIRAGLPVPATAILEPGDDAAGVGVPLPAVVKPLPRRHAAWRRLAGHAKALRVDDVAALEAAAARVAAAAAEPGDARLLVQQLIEGDETRIESYPAYVDATGAVVGEFTGRKIRTSPPDYGASTALVTTDAADVRRAGRDLVERLDFRGVLKADFKRDADGRLWLLEINPRFNLWHHLGARAGVNLPALVYADRAGRPRPAVAAAQAGRTWCVPWQDAAMARRSGTGLVRWARWARHCDAYAVADLRDPLPVVRGKVWPAVAGRLRSR